MNGLNIGYADDIIMLPNSQLPIGDISIVNGYLIITYLPMVILTLLSRVKYSISGDATYPAPSTNTFF